jgi:hypothetical protein
MFVIRKGYALYFAAFLVLIAVQPVLSQTMETNKTARASMEIIPNERLWAHDIQSALIAEKFDDLDVMADKFRSEKTRKFGGEWLLQRFYASLDAPQLTDQDSLDHLAHLNKWIELRPKSITARVALATSLMRWAWVARGSGFAKTVTPEGWKLFRERGQKALDVLNDASNLEAKCPQWYLEMFAVGMDLHFSGEQMKNIFEQGVRLEPEYYYLYRTYADYLLPKWYGTRGASSSFAKNAADQLGGADGDLLYYQIVTMLVKYGDDDYPVQELDWPRIQSGYQALIAKYGFSRNTKNVMAYVAYTFKDVTVTRNQFAKIGDDWDSYVWHDRKMFDRARDWAISR